MKVPFPLVTLRASSLLYDMGEAGRMDDLRMDAPAVRWK